jgi:hypothetical protein
MTETVELAGAPLGVRFIIRWVGVAMVATALSSSAAISLAILAAESNADAYYYLVVAAVLSFPLLSALGNSWLFRREFRRPVLWGALTGGGLVGAMASLVVLVTTFDDLWGPISSQLASWFARGLGLARPPSAFVSYSGGGALLGLVLGGIQAAALDFDWAARARWIAVSVVAGWLATIPAYLFLEVDTANGLLGQIAEILPLSDDWSFVPILVLVVLTAHFFFALPTGLFMWRLLVRHRHAEAAALMRRFD